MIMTNMRSSILAFAFFFALTASAGSPEYLVGQSVATPATSLRFLPAVASNGTDFFVVWIDDLRIGSSSIIGTRVTRDGDVLDRSEFRSRSRLGVGAARVGRRELPRRSDAMGRSQWRQDVLRHASAHGGVVMLPRMIAARG
jgi:hypothetical protein